MKITKFTLQRIIAESLRSKSVAEVYAKRYGMDLDDMEKLFQLLYHSDPDRRRQGKELAKLLGIQYLPLELLLGWREKYVNYEMKRIKSFIRQLFPGMKVVQNNKYLQLPPGDFSVSFETRDESGKLNISGKHKSPGMYTFSIIQDDNIITYDSSDSYESLKEKIEYHITMNDLDW
jgi:hypothetical protein